MKKRRWVLIAVMGPFAAGAVMLLWLEIVLVESSPVTTLRLPAGSLPAFLQTEERLSIAEKTVEQGVRGERWGIGLLNPSGLNEVAGSIMSSIEGRPRIIIEMPDDRGVIYRTEDSRIWIWVLHRSLYRYDVYIERYEQPVILFSDP